MTNTNLSMKRRPASRARALVRVFLLGGGLLLATACAGAPTAPVSSPAALVADQAQTGSQHLSPPGSAAAARSGYMLSSGLDDER